MSQSIAQALSSLRDVDGIIGSFVVNSDGELVAQDLPAYFADVAEEVAPRIHRLCDALSLSEGAVSACTVRYTNHKLTLRLVQGALLAVLTGTAVNAPALRTAMNLVARKCAAQDLSSAADTSRASTRPPPSVTPPEVAPRSSSATAATLPAMVAVNAHVPEPSGPPETRRSVGAAAPEAGTPNAPKKDRAVFFRGKRIG